MRTIIFFSIFHLSAQSWIFRLFDLTFHSPRFKNPTSTPFKIQEFKSGTHPSGQLSPQGETSLSVHKLEAIIWADIPKTYREAFGPNSRDSLNSFQSVCWTSESREEAQHANWWVWKKHANAESRPPRPKLVWQARQVRVKELQMEEKDSERLGIEIESLKAKVKEMDERLGALSRESKQKKIIAATIVSLFVVYFLVINLWIK